MKRLIIPLVLLISGCGALPEPSNYKQVWAETVACTELTASRPEAVVIPDVFWDVATDADAKYDSKTEVITVKESNQRDRDLIAHEMVHHLLYKTSGSSDSDHVNPLFAQCGYAA